MHELHRRKRGAAKAAIAVAVAIGVIGGSAAPAIAGSVQVMPDNPEVVGPQHAQAGTVLTGDYVGETDDPGEPYTVDVEWEKCFDDFGTTCWTLKRPDGGSAEYDDLPAPYTTTYQLRPEDLGYAIVYSVFVHGTTPGSQLGQVRISHGFREDGVAPSLANAIGGIAATVVNGTPLDGQQLRMGYAAPFTTSFIGSQPYMWRGAFTWERCDAAGGACSPAFTANPFDFVAHNETSADVGHTMRAVVTETNAWGSTTVTSSPSGVIQALPTTNIAAPTLDGDPIDGSELHAHQGTWRGSTPITEADTWERCDALGADCAPTGETGPTIRLGPDDVGHTLRLTATATGPGGDATAESDQSTVIAALPPVNVAVPTLADDDGADPQSGAPDSLPSIRVGGTLSVGGDAWNGTRNLTVSVQWEKRGAQGATWGAIEGASERSYKPSSDDVGDELRARITATNTAGTAEAVTDPVLVLGELGAAAPQQQPPAAISDTSPALTAVPSSWSRTPVVLGFGRPSVRCAPELRDHLAGAGALSVRGALPGAATVLAGGQPVLTLTGGDGSLVIRKAGGKLLGVARDSGTVRFRNRSRDRVSARSGHGKALVVIGRNARDVVVKGRVCTYTSSASSAVAARADRAVRATVYATTDTGTPLAGATLTVTDHGRARTLQTDQHGRARVLIPASSGRRDLTLSYAGDDEHQAATLPLAIAVRGVTTLHGRASRSTLTLHGTAHGPSPARIRVEYLDASHYWRTLAATATTGRDRWTIRARTPRHRAGGTQVIVRALIARYGAYAARVGRPVRITVTRGRGR